MAMIYKLIGGKIIDKKKLIKYGLFISFILIVMIPFYTFVKENHNSLKTDNIINNNKNTQLLLKKCNKDNDENCVKDALGNKCGIMGNSQQKYCCLSKSNTKNNKYCDLLPDNYNCINNFQCNSGICSQGKCVN
jgi:hypothetical protein